MCYFQVRLSLLLENKVAMLKLTLSVRRMLSENETEDHRMTSDLATLRAAWDSAHLR